MGFFKMDFSPGTIDLLNSFRSVKNTLGGVEFLFTSSGLKMTMPFDPPNTNKPVEVFKNEPSAKSWLCMPSDREKFVNVSVFKLKRLNPSNVLSHRELFFSSARIACMLIEGKPCSLV